MTIYKSRQVNTDPDPWVNRVTGARFDSSSPGPNGETGIEPRRKDFYSFSPRPEFNATRDRRPWIDVNGNRHTRVPKRYNGDHTRAAVTWAPRPEFDNPVNPILAEFRKEMLVSRLTSKQEAALWIEVENWDSPYFRDRFTFTPDQIDHARRVLTRLANWSAS